MVIPPLLPDCRNPEKSEMKLMATPKKQLKKAKAVQTKAFSPFFGFESPRFERFEERFEPFFFERFEPRFESPRFERFEEFFERPFFFPRRFF
jgi:hypothetical protein